MSEESMADHNVDWDTCTGSDDCIGVCLPTGGKCWAHADDTDLDAALKRLGEDGYLDARGVVISRTLLERLLAAAPCDQGRAILAEAHFKEATFESDAAFNWVTFRGPAGFQWATFQRGAWFVKAIFHDRAGFFSARIHGPAQFDGVTFHDEAMFQKATFDSHAWLLAARFHGHADFIGATFEDEAAFRDAVFADQASFRGATFKSLAEFYKVTFKRDALFIDAVFQGDTQFFGATFLRGAWFARTTFQQARQLGPMLVRKSLVLDEAVFYQRTQIEVTAVAICCQRTRFLAGVQLRVRWAQVILDDADLAAPSILTGVPPFPNLDEGRLARAVERLLPQPRIEPQWRWQPRLLSLRSADVAGLSLSYVDLRACQFAGAHNLDKLRVETVLDFAHTPGGWRWTARRVLAEEHYWRHQRVAGRDAPGHASATAASSRLQPRQDRIWWPSACRPPAWAAPSRPLDPAQVADLYRALRKGREDNKDEPGAADFYYGEMEMRRHAKHGEAKDERRRRHYGPWLSATTERAVLWLYWLVSGYGLRAWRALAALALVIGLVGVGFSRVGFHHPHPSQLVSWLYALQATVSLEGKAPQLSGQLTLPGELFRVGLRFTGPVLLGLALLSIRGRVKR
jgi:uncharacterized protein YjbI with pentapeptide repeats